MKITEFCNGRGVTSDAIRRYISRHKEAFEGHTTYTGYTTELDEEAVELLSQKYPLPPVVYDQEAREKLERAQATIIELQGKLLDQAKLAASAESAQKLLEVQERELATKEAEAEALRGQVEVLKARAEAAEQEAATLKSRTFWQRLRNK